ncbi:MAG: SUMF1/EgtB/PvdO family nonheme iron enzyme [Phycisphaerales bacterium]
MRTRIASILMAAAACSGALAQSCPGDIDGNGEVDGEDLGILLSAWGRCTPGAPTCPSDLNGDAFVNADDLGLLLGQWGCPTLVPAWASLVEALPDPAVVTDAKLRADIIATRYAWRVRDTATQIEMLLVPPGTFQMGCSASDQHGCAADEGPVHPVTLTNPFYLGRHEVTQAQWIARMGSNPSFFTAASAQVPVPQVATRPVERVTWSQAQGFLASTGMRLPTEAEWEFACRAGTGTAFANGSDAEAAVADVAWTSGSALGQTWPVGLKPGNRLGFHDMHGNVWEWVSDWYSASYYASSPTVDPAGPATGTFRVFRGGSWNYEARHARSSCRFTDIPGYSRFTGFRVARNP